ncbi:MAG TPA: hypothetical protein VGG19_12665 [Tepidisphaeraceae bacterium]|jgi:hypothetical protein
MVAFNKFFEISEAKNSDSAFRVINSGTHSRSASNALIRGEITPDSPISYVEYMGSNLLDVIGTAKVGRYILSERLFERFDKEGFTGWISYPVHITRKDGTLLEGYRGLSITGRCADWDPKSGELISEKLGGGLGDYLQVKGLYFNPSSYDGSDFFMFESRYFICITKRVRDVLLDMKATNIRLTPLPEVIIPVSEEP